MQAGEYLLAEDEAIRHISVVRSGTLKLCRPAEEEGTIGEAIVEALAQDASERAGFAQISTGDIIGESQCLYKQNCAVFIRAETKCRILQIPRSNIMQMLPRRCREYFDPPDAMDSPLASPIRHAAGMRRPQMGKSPGAVEHIGNAKGLIQDVKSKGQNGVGMVVTVSGVEGKAARAGKFEDQDLDRFPAPKSCVEVGPSLVRISGMLLYSVKQAQGIPYDGINGVFEPTDRLCNGRCVYQKRGSDSICMWWANNSGKLSWIVGPADCGEQHACIMPAFLVISIQHCQGAHA
jgi:hypothetical protein